MVSAGTACPGHEHLGFTDPAFTTLIKRSAAPVLVLEANMRSSYFLHDFWNKGTDRKAHWLVDAKDVFLSASRRGIEINRDQS